MVNAAPAQQPGDGAPSRPGGLSNQATGTGGAGNQSLVIQAATQDAVGVGQDGQGNAAGAVQQQTKRLGASGEHSMIDPAVSRRPVRNAELQMGDGDHDPTAASSHQRPGHFPRPAPPQRDRPSRPWHREPARGGQSQQRALDATGESR